MSHHADVNHPTFIEVWLPLSIQSSSPAKSLLILQNCKKSILQYNCWERSKTRYMTHWDSVDSVHRLATSCLGLFILQLSFTIQIRNSSNKRHVHQHTLTDFAGRRSAGTSDLNSTPSASAAKDTPASLNSVLEKSPSQSPEENMNLEDLDADDLEGDLSLTARPNYSQDWGEAHRENSKSPSVEPDHIAEEQETGNTSPSGKSNLRESSEEAVGDDEYLSGKENIQPSINTAADEQHINQKSERTPNRWASGSLGDSCVLATWYDC